MVKHLLCLLFLLVSNSSFGAGCTVIDGKFSADCLACKSGVGSSQFQQQYCTGVTSPITVLPETPRCVPASITETRPCPVNYSGVEQWKKDTNCTTSGSTIEVGWIKTSDTCKPLPPTCKPTVETRTLSCPSGYTGTLTQTQASICTNPYGSPIFQGNWTTSSGMCVKSVSNPTNPVSPINVTATPTAPVIAPQAPVPTTTQTPTETAEASTTSSPSPAPPAVQTPAKGAVTRALELTQKLTLVGALPKQPTIIELLSLTQELPDGIRRQQNLFLELIQPDDSWLDRDVPPSYRWGGILWD